MRIPNSRQRRDLACRWRGIWGEHQLYPLKGQLKWRWKPWKVMKYTCDLLPTEVCNLIILLRRFRGVFAWYRNSESVDMIPPKNVIPKRILPVWLHPVSVAEQEFHCSTTFRISIIQLKNNHSPRYRTLGGLEWVAQAQSSSSHLHNNICLTIISCTFIPTRYEVRWSHCKRDTRSKSQAALKVDTLSENTLCHRSTLKIRCG